MLAMRIEIGLGHRIGVQPSVGQAGLARLGPTAGQTAIEHEMHHVDVFGRQLARNANFGIENGTDCAKALTLAVAPVKKIDPRPCASMRFAAAWAVKKPAKAVVR
jgi:hypothetical protein